MARDVWEITRCYREKKDLTAKAGKTKLNIQKAAPGQGPFLCPLPKKLNHARMNDPREAAYRGAEGEGKNSQAKGSDQDGTSESARQRRCTPKGQPETGISQVTTEAEGPKGSFCLSFCAKTAVLCFPQRGNSGFALPVAEEARPGFPQPRHWRAVAKQAREWQLRQGGQLPRSG